MAGVAISAEVVRIELGRILASSGFAQNARLSAFLEFVVRSYLEGHSDQIKETIIAVEVFGRKPDYDPRQDSVVRTEAAKLRARLAEYYAGPGASDPVVIEIPKGHYVPLVRNARESTRFSSWRRRWVLALVAALLPLAFTGYWIGRNLDKAEDAPEPLSIGVLPFANLSADPANDYFSDGLTEEVIDALMKVEGLRVPAKGSAFAFKGKRPDLRAVGEKLRVQMVLEGSVRIDGRRVRVSVQLNKIADGFPLWSETYDRDMDDVLGLQTEIAYSIGAALEVKLADNRRPAQRTASAEAHRLYMKARYFQNQGPTSPASQNRAIAYFEQAIENDPQYALAYAGLSDSWYNIYQHDPQRPADALPNAETAATKALAIDDTLSGAHAALANALASKWDWQGADREFLRAIELNPNNGRARLHYAVHCLILTDRPDRALQEAGRAQNLDLISPEVYGQFGMLLYGLRRYDEAIELSRKALEMHDRAIGAQNTLGLSYAQKGMLAEAVAAFEKAESFGVRRSHWSASLVALYVRLGRRAEAEKLLELWKSRPSGEFGHAQSLAMAYAGLGDKDQALQWLEKAYEEHWRGLPVIKVVPDFDVLRSDPRFEALLRKMGL